MIIYSNEMYLTNCKKYFFKISVRKQTIDKNDYGYIDKL
jgi:hypothetical protein